MNRKLYYKIYAALFILAMWLSMGAVVILSYRQDWSRFTVWFANIFGSACGLWLNLTEIRRIEDMEIMDRKDSTE